MDDKLTAKTAKFTSLENLYAYGICMHKSDTYTHNSHVHLHTNVYTCTHTHTYSCVYICTHNYFRGHKYFREFHYDHKNLS